MAPMSAACAEEKEILQDMYLDDFLQVSEAEWQIRFRADASLRVLLPEDYPNSREAPQLVVDGDQTVDDGIKALLAKLRREFRPDAAEQQWIVEWLQTLNDAFDDGSISAPVEVEAREEAHKAEEQSQGTSVTVPLGGGVSQSALDAALLSAGFQRCSEPSASVSIFAHSDKGLTAEVTSSELQMTVDGIDAEDLTDWATMQLAEDASHFGDRFVAWATAQRSAEPGFDETSEAGETIDGLDFLPSVEQMGVQTDREVLIYTWGKALRKSAPPDSQCNFNAGILNGRGGGADLRTMNGTSDEVQRNVASCGLFPRWIEMVINKIEKTPCHTISINCTKGRHRSVAAAEILRKFYYPNAVLRHLTIY
eukprot:TRINITY_DN27806_c0_g1_i1.p1 TRINITY_DN27806_c0_g1~~TRINITY_DN27806_c0_g1_i1.p1  ORF type:complete len:390 (+),score=86.41 TRINITY_DN27806_c0_g1_i1:73-1170(+)